ncbi:MAG: hypothetical protein U0359_01950 [Byssovorax sp.]
MPGDNRKLNLHLDPETLAELERHIADDVRKGHLQLSEGHSFVLDSASSEPGRTSLYSRVKSQLGPYIDFEHGGLRMLDLNVGGHPATVTLAPGWDRPPPGAKGFGGPSITLKFSMSW